jgi:hypothetical protein
MRLNILTLTTAVVSALLLSACGGGGGDASFKNGETIISLASVQCKTTPTTTDISNYETLLSGDTIVKDDNNATVIIYHDVNGTKKICLVNNGSTAHILR